MRKMNQASPETEKLLMTMDEAAQTLSMGRYTLHRLLQRKQIQAISEGRRRLVVVASLHTYINSQLEGVPQ